jgi:hypothetical protein
LRKERGSRIHAGLVGRRELVGTGYLGDAELRQEYTEEIAPRTGAALAKVLDELFGRGPADRAPDAAGAFRPRVLDLGAGTGAAGDAARAFFGAATEVIAVDRIAAPGVITSDLAAAGPMPGVTGRFDLIIAAHLLNELFLPRPVEQRVTARATRIVAWCESLLAPGGTFIVLEPALRETSRQLLAVRDQLLVAGLHVIAPCLWQGPCPALARERDWCHDAAPAEPTSVGGKRSARVDFSYLALRREPAPANDDLTLFRIVSDPLVEKGRLRLFGCGPAGRNALVRLDRHHSLANQAFDDLARGDLAHIRGTSNANDGWRLDAQTTVEAASHAARDQSADRSP